MTENESEIAQLKTKRQLLIKRLEDIKADYRQGLSADSDEQAIQLENAEVLEGIIKVTTAELDEVEKRISQLNA